MVQASPHLRDARVVKGFTQQAVADLIGVQQPAIAMWESGARVPNAWVASRLAHVLGTTVEAIWPHDQQQERGRAAQTADPVTANRRNP